ncbi:hypothetical protein [Sinorhizobium meliloti]
MPVEKPVDRCGKSDAVLHHVRPAVGD